jgi:hypothetical protein
MKAAQQYARKRRITPLRHAYPIALDILFKSIDVHNVPVYEAGVQLAEFLQ